MKVVTSVVSSTDQRERSLGGRDVHPDGSRRRSVPFVGCDRKRPRAHERRAASGGVPGGTMSSFESRATASAGTTFTSRRSSPRTGSAYRIARCARRDGGASNVERYGGAQQRRTQTVAFRRCFRPAVDIARRGCCRKYGCVNGAFAGAVTRYARFVRGDLTARGGLWRLHCPPRR